MKANESNAEVVLELKAYAFKRMRAAGVDVLAADDAAAVLLLRMVELIDGITRGQKS